MCACMCMYPLTHTYTHKSQDPASELATWLLIPKTPRLNLGSDLKHSRIPVKLLFGNPHLGVTMPALLSTHCVFYD